jgi:hypothetical protein
MWYDSIRLKSHKFADSEFTASVLGSRDDGLEVVPILGSLSKDQRVHDSCGIECW